MMRMRSLSIAFAAAFGCSACLLLVDTTGLTGGTDPDVTPIDGAAPNEGGGGTDGSFVDAGTDADADAMVDAGPTYRDLVMADAPVAYLRLGETSASVARDETGAHDGAISGNVTPADSLIRDDQNGAMKFAGNGYIAIPPFDGMLAGTKPFSIEAWILIGSAPPSTMWILGRDDVGSPRYGNSLFVSTTNDIAIEQWQNGTGASRAGKGPLVFNVPVHVVATFSGTTLALFFDGKSSTATVSNAPVQDVGAAIVIGAQSKHQSGFFTGTIDEVALYDHVLPTTSITAHYERGKP